MSPSKYIFTLDLRTVQSQMSLPVTQGDTNRTLVISFSDGGKPFVLGSGATAMISLVRPTGTSVQEFCLIEDDGARVVYNFSEHTCAVSGLHKCQIVLYNSEGKQIASPKFAINASPKLIDGDDLIIPDEDITAIDAIYIAEAQRQSAESERKEAEALRKSNTQAAITEINEVKASIEAMRDNGDFDGDDGEDGISPLVSVTPISTGYDIKITDKEGAKTFKLHHGSDGAAGVSAFHEWDGTTLIIHSAAGSSSYDLKGEKGDKGDRGDGIDIVRSFTTIAEMLTGAATDGVPVGKFVVIASGNVDDPENARLYVKTENGYLYLTDLSGAQGIRGEKGDQGERGPQGIQGIQGEKGDTYTLTEADKAEIIDDLARNKEIVKKDDYATSINVGVMKAGAGLAAAANGMIITQAATEEMIDAKTDNYRVLTSKNLDYAVKKAVSANGIELTDDEKSSAQEWLGIGYATQDTAGVVKVHTGYGTRMVNGVLDLMPAQYSEIDVRKSNNYPLFIVNDATRHMIVPANVDYAVKKSLTDNKLVDTDYAWTDEEKASARALLGTVSDTAGATSSTMGLVTVNSSYGITVEPSDKHKLKIVGCSEEQITNRSDMRAITPNRLDFAIKSGLTANALTLTDDEKASAQQWLGIDTLIGDICTALDELHTYAQSLVNGGNA